eukprot:gene13455-15900_t
MLGHQKYGSKVRKVFNAPSLQNGSYCKFLQQELRYWVVAACGTLKGGRADWLVEKCTELGAVSFIPLLTGVLRE